MILAQLPGIPTPPANSPVAFLGWAVAIAMGVAIFVWRLREKERTELIGGLRAQLADRDAALFRLGEKLDQEREKRREEAERAVMAITRRSSPEQAARGAEQWEELPTAMRNMLTLVAKAVTPAEEHADPFADLEGWTPTGSKRPEPPRKKLPSRDR